MRFITSTAVLGLSVLVSPTAATEDAEYTAMFEQLSAPESCREQVDQIITSHAVHPDDPPITDVALFREQYMEACEEEKQISRVQGSPVVDSSCEENERSLFKKFHFGTNAKSLYSQAIKKCARRRYLNWIKSEKDLIAPWGGDDELSLAMTAAAQGRAARNAFRIQKNNEINAENAAKNPKSNTAGKKYSTLDYLSDTAKHYARVFRYNMSPPKGA